MSVSGTRPHAWNHISWERATVAEIIARKWYESRERKPCAHAAAKPKPSLRDVRRARAVENLKRAETRLKRAATIAKKWRAAVRRYDRAAAVNPVLTTDTGNAGLSK
jgi:hypothetical protein